MIDRFGVIVADPPWNYNRTSESVKLTGYSDKQYPPITTDDLCALGATVQRISSPDAVLFMWTTWPFIADALRVIEAWGFRYVTGLPWVKMDKRLTKPSYGVGYWFRGCTEPILVAKRGKSFRSNMRGIVGYASSPEGHSIKPDALQELIESRYPGPYLELFGRKPREGWKVLGNEAPGDGDDIRRSLRRLRHEVKRR